MEKGDSARRRALCFAIVFQTLPPQLMDSAEIVEKRLEHLRHRLQKDSAPRMQYVEAMNTA